MEITPVAILATSRVWDPCPLTDDDKEDDEPIPGDRAYLRTASQRFGIGAQTASDPQSGYLAAPQNLQRELSQLRRNFNVQELQQVADRTEGHDDKGDMPTIAEDVSGRPSGAAGLVSVPCQCSTCQVLTEPMDRMTGLH